MRAIEVGHAEELLGGALCVFAVLLADRERPVLAGLALGVAIANKEWALLAIGPVLIALPAARTRCLLSAAAAAAVLLAPILIAHASSFVSGASGVASANSEIFQPMQLFWFLGHHSASAARLLGAEKYDFRLAPTWIGRISHPLVIAVAPPLSWLTWRGLRARRLASAGDGARRGVLTSSLLLLALLLLLRCMLDTWDNVYYPLPFLLALLAWEAESGRAPALALLGVVLVWTNAWLSLHTSADVQAAFFLLWSLPFAAILGLLLFAPERALARGRVSSHRREDGAQEMIVKPFSSPLSTS
jgi:hypothetical protein